MHCSRILLPSGECLDCRLLLQLIVLPACYSALASCVLYSYYDYYHYYYFFFYYYYYCYCYYYYYDYYYHYEYYYHHNYYNY